MTRIVSLLLHLGFAGIALASELENTECAAAESVSASQAPLEEVDYGQEDAAMLQVTQQQNSSTLPKCSGGADSTVARRRRMGRMCSCRRRSVSDGLQKSTDEKGFWTCASGNGVRMVARMPTYSKVKGFCVDDEGRDVGNMAHLDVTAIEACELTCSLDVACAAYEWRNTDAYLNGHNYGKCFTAPGNIKGSGVPGIAPTRGSRSGGPNCQLKNRRV